MRKTYKIPFSEGFHSRPVMELVTIARTYPELNLRICKINTDNVNIPCTNMIKILYSGIKYNDEVSFAFDVENKEALQKLSNLLNKE